MNFRFSSMNLPRFPRLGEQEIKELIEKAQKGDVAAREKLINCNLKLVFKVVERFLHRGYEVEDLFQIGTIGLIKAIDKFDLKQQVKFSTYAVPMIVGEIRRFLRDDQAIRISRSTKELGVKILKEKEALTVKLGREPTIAELEETLGYSREAIVEALEAGQSLASLFETVHQDDGDPIYLLDQIKQEGDEEQTLLENISIKEVLSKLEPRERYILINRFFKEKTQMEIARTLGISQVQVSRLERQALLKLKRYLNES
ncbi:RNA polymerase sigma-F factor [Carboxydothermus hydrogenoformans Z-2901]|uniref:RNA polymerase sigma factor n=2 Tax=Carboxydothermus hydrogenoformans TaxID=129958 RepID=Q3AAQ6_CARHZ|nr:RNA polymerase sigma-F factor [Carboxydothermus hydrogenoformans Z-2901]